MRRGARARAGSDPSPRRRGPESMRPPPLAGARSLTAAKPAAPPWRSHHTRAPTATSSAAGGIVAAAAAVRRARGRRAPGRREPGPGPGGGRRGPVQTDGGDGWGALSPQSHTPRAAGRSGLSGRVSSSGAPLASPWGPAAEALTTGGEGRSSARRAARHLCDLAGEELLGGRLGGGLEGGGGDGGGRGGRGQEGGEGAGRWQSYQVGA